MKRVSGEIDRLGLRRACAARAIGQIERDYPRVEIGITDRAEAERADQLLHAGRRHLVIETNPQRMSSKRRATTPITPTRRSLS